MKVFDYVVFYAPNADDAKTGAKAEIIAEGRMLKKDQKAAELEVTRKIDEKWDDKIDDVVISIRAF